MEKLNEAFSRNARRGRTYGRTAFLGPLLALPGVQKTKYEKDGSDFEDQINKIDKKYWILVVWLKKKTVLNTKVTKIEGKIPSVTGLATN